MTQALRTSNFKIEVFSWHFLLFHVYISKIRSPKFMLLFPRRCSSCKIPCTAFKPASLTEVSKLILSSPNKSRELDPIPTFLLKSCLHTLFIPITKIIHLSLCSGVFPSQFKPSLPANYLNNYRPISNLSFISNIL